MPDKKVFFSLLTVSILIFIFASIFISFQNPSPQNLPEAKSGILDLAKWDFEKNGIIKLNGEWEFYWHKLLSYKDFEDKKIAPDIFANAPDHWNSYTIDNENLPGKGFATYRLHLFTGLSAGKLVGIRVSGFATAYSLFVNDTRIASNGTVGSTQENAVPQVIPLIVVFTAPSAEFDLIVQVSNFDYGRGGFWSPIYLGSVAEIYTLQETTREKEFFLIASYIMAAAYFLFLFFLNRESADNLYFSALCLSYALFMSMSGECLGSSLIPNQDFRITVTLYNESLSLTLLFLVLFISELFPTSFTKTVIKFLLVYVSGTTLLFFLTSVAFYSQFAYIFFTAALFVICYSLVLVLIGVLRKKPGALINFGIILGLLLTSCQIIFSWTNLISSDFGLGIFLWGGAVLLAQSVIQAQKLTGAYREKAALVERLYSLDRLKDEFLANTSHELRTPLHAITALADGMMLGEVNQNQKNSLSLIASSGRRLSTLVNSILDYSKMRHGDLKINLAPVDLSVVVENTFKVLGTLNTSSSVQLINKIGPDLPSVLADEDRVYQILYNLVGNSLKFTSQGYIEVSARIISDRVELCVYDTGPGIPIEKQEAIFKSFDQLDSGSAHAHVVAENEGTGLGLPISRQLVDLQGGSIWVESKPGSGSKFFFTLPVAKENVGAALTLDQSATTSLLKENPLNRAAIRSQNREEAEVFGEASLKSVDQRTRILLVDDNITNLKSLEIILTLNGYNVTSLSVGKFALEEIRKDQSISVALLDVMMPEVSGIEICREIRQSKSLFDLPVLMLTSRAGTQDIVECFAAGANDFLKKPFETEELLARVRTLVELKKSIDKAIAAEISFLQAQIKPHFLFNALSVITSLSTRNPEKARTLVVDLGEFLRNSFDFDSSAELIPLHKELELIAAYLAIEKAWLRKNISYELEWDEILDVSLPRLVLQPLVENALRHGLIPSPTGDYIRLKIWKSGQRVNFEVSDNGIGMPADVVESFRNSPDSSRGVGLKNINKRLVKYYGSGLSITSVQNQGTVVSFSIPLQGFS